MKRRIMVMGLVVFVVGAAAALAVNFTPGGSVTADIPQATVQQRHTLQDFQDLRDGISYDGATRTLGHLAHEVLRGTSEEVPGISADAKMYTWPNPNGSRIVLVFREDRLIQKIQFGLH